MELGWKKLTLHWCHVENSFNLLVSGHIDLKLYYKDLIKYKNSIYSFNFMLEDTRIQYKWIFRLESIELINLQTDAFQTLLSKL